MSRKSVSRRIPGDITAGIISASPWGLANRLKCLISCMRIADRYSSPLLLHWPVSEACSCAFSDLMENEISQVRGSAMTALQPFHHKIIGDDIISEIDACPDLFTKFVMVRTSRLLPLPEDRLPENFSREARNSTGRNIDYEYDRIPANVRANILPFVRKLVPKEAIARAVDEFASSFSRDTVSVGIRSWATPLDADRKGVFDIRNVYRAMDRMDGSDFFVVSDSQEVLSRLAKRYGKRILTYPRKTSPGRRNSKAAIQDAMIELLLLSKNKSMIVSYSSTFYELAWWLGGCEARVDVFDDLPHVREFFLRLWQARFQPPPRAARRGGRGD